MQNIIRALSVTMCAAALVVSCARDGDAARGGESRELAVNVRMQSSDWTTRANGAASASTPVALGEQLEIVTEYGTQETPETPLTRGTPMGSAAELKTLGFAVYTNSAFTKNCTATSNSGSWSVANNITLHLDKNKYSYYAYAPAATAGNGIVAAADGKSLTYTAPADITQQPDLCRATPITDDNTGLANFAMQHALTSVGIKVRAANVTIKSIKLTQVGTSGKLDLTNGTWGGVGTPKDLAFTLLAPPSAGTGDGLADLTPVDGYLMLPPQTLTGDNQTLVIKYQYKGETTDRIGEHKLKDITGGAWLAGQKVNYVIQLKSNFSLSITPASASVQYTAGKYEFGYTTGSSAPSIDPQATDDVDWVTGFSFDRVNHKISFDYAANTTSMLRKASITVTSGFTTQTFTLTQEVSPYVLINGTWWTKTNLTGTYGTNAGHAMEASPQGYGAFFKWGTSFVYQRATSNSDGGGWGDYTTGAATSPSSGSGTGYDYGLGLAGGLDPGDPCQKLGANFRAPTHAQCQALNSAGSKWGSYNGIAGRFFGPNAASCDNTTLKADCIFLPASGRRYYSDGTQNYQGSEGRYWSSSVYNSNRSYNCYFSSSNGYPNDYYSRGYGLSVRCIYVL